MPRLTTRVARLEGSATGAAGRAAPWIARLAPIAAAPHGNPGAFAPVLARHLVREPATPRRRGRALGFLAASADFGRGASRVGQGPP